MNSIEKDFAVLYFNREKGRYLVVAEAPFGVGRGEINDTAEIDVSSFDGVISRVLLKFLNAFRSNVFSSQNARGRNREENKRFINDHIGVMVERCPSGEIILRPLHHKQGGFVALPGEQSIVPAAELSKELPKALRESFKIAT